MYGPFDKQLELKALGEVTTTADAAGVAIPVRMAGDFKAVIYVSAFDAGSPPGGVTLTVSTDSLAAFSDDPVTVGSVEVFDVGVYEIPLSGKAIEQRDPDAAAIRVGATIDDGRALTYGTFLTPAV